MMPGSQITDLSSLKKENNHSNKPDCLDYCSRFRSTSDRKSEEGVIKMTNRVDYRQLIRPFKYIHMYISVACLVDLVLRRIIVQMNF